MASTARSIGVVGAGYVGLVTAVGLASLGHSVQLIEIRADRLEALRDGRSPIHEDGLQEALSTVLRGGRLAVAQWPASPCGHASVGD